MIPASRLRTVCLGDGSEELFITVAGKRFYQGHETRFRIGDRAEFVGREDGTLLVGGNEVWAAAP